MKYSVRTEVARLMLLTKNLNSVIPGYDPGFESPSNRLRGCNVTTFCNVHRQRLEVPSMLWVGVGSRYTCPNCEAVFANPASLSTHRQFCEAELIFSND